LKVLLKLNNGDLVDFEINEVGVLGTGSYYPKDKKYGIPIKPYPHEVDQWLKEGKVLDIQFRNEKEMAMLIRNLLEYRSLRMKQTSSYRTSSKD